MDGNTIATHLLGVALAVSAGILYRIYHRKLKTDQSSVVWIIGASSGIGRELAVQYAMEGKKVILSSRNHSTLVDVQQKLVEITERDKSNFPILLVDIEKDNEFEEITRNAITFFGSVDVLCISSGLGIRAFSSETTPEVEKRMLQTNYLGPILLAKTLLPSMRSRHCGTIVFISSIQGLLAVPGRSSYSGAKHALQGYCDSLRAEESRHGINILTVSPAYVRTNHSIHSIRGDGTAYNKMDKTTQKGMEPSDLAKQIRSTVVENKGNLVVAPLYMKVVNVLQSIFPGGIQWYMARKANKMENM